MVALLVLRCFTIGGMELDEFFDQVKFQECKEAVRELLAVNRQRIKEQGICDQGLEDSLKDLEWAVNTAERLIARVTDR